MRQGSFVSLSSALLAVSLAGLFCAVPARGQLYVRVESSDYTYKDDTIFSKRFAYISASGIEGHLFLPTPANACSYIDPPPGGFPVNDTWIALVYDYPSCPSDMVMNVRNAGYKVIIASSRNDSHRTVSKEVGSSFFPIVIVKKEYADRLKEKLKSTTDPIFVLVKGSIETSLVLVCTFCSFFCCTSCCLSWLDDKRRSHKNRGTPFTGTFGIQNHLQDITHWRRYFTKKTSAACVIAMDNFAINQVWVLIVI